VPIEYRYAGPDGDGIDVLPEGSGAAVGSEYCVHLLPSPAALYALCAKAAGRRIPLLLLTPYFRDSELKAAVGLVRSIPPDTKVEVAVNDWGLLLAMRSLFPEIPLSIGRLLSGQKRCPRIAGSSRLTEEGRAWHGEGIFSSARARRFLEEEYGVQRYHVDDLDWMRSDFRTGQDAEMGASAPRLCVHVPFAIVTVTDRCPWIGGRSSADFPSCSRPCLEGTVGLWEPSMGEEMIQRGKARFLRTDSRGGPGSPAHGPATRVVYSEAP